MTYSEEQLSNIAKEIVENSKKSRADSHYIGKDVKDDWDDELYIHDLYEQYLQTVQQEHPNKFTGEVLDTKTSTFTKYLRSCLQTLKWRRGHLQTELERGDIDHRIYNNGKAIADMAESAIKLYLEKTETQQLIGI